MKRILYSCFSVVFLFLFGTVKGQQMQISPNPLCGTPLPASGFYTTVASMQQQVPGANDYTWSVIGGPAGCTPTITPILGGIPTNSSAIIAVPCAGEYTIASTGLAGGFPIITTNTASPFLSGGYDHFVIFSPTMAAITSTPASGAICAGETITLSAQTTPTSTGTTYVWNTAALTNSISASPLSNTCYSVVGTIPIPTLPSGCTVTASSCVSVQTQSLSISPSTQTICSGTSTTLTALPSSNAVSYTWSPSGTNTSTDVVTPPPIPNPNIYTVAATFTGVAGTCTLEATSSITTGTSVTMILSSSSPSTCPQSNFTLTANPTNAIGNYTWIPLSPVGTNSFSASNSNTFLINSTTVFSVNALFPGGCPGSNTISVGVTVLTPSLTASSPSICPNTVVTLSATGGVTYTFSGLPTPILNTVTANSATHAPATLPKSYIVTADSLGCKGTANITIYKHTLTPTMAVSSISNCPNSSFTLSSLPCQYSYTFVASSPSSNTIIPIGLPGSCSVTSSTSIFPATYTLTADSSGCKGTSAITIYSLNFTPTLTASSPSVCPNTTFTLITHGGDSFTVTNPGGSTTPTVVPTRSVISSATTFPATYTLTVDSAGCIGRKSTITIYSLALNPLFGITANTNSVCPTSPITFTAHSSSNNAPVGALTFTYFNGSTVILSSPNTATSTIYNIPANFTAGTFSIIADSSGCKGTANITLYKRTIQPVLSLSSPSVCANTHVTVTANGLGSGTNYSFTAQPINSTSTFTIQQATNQPTTNWIFDTPSVVTTYTVRVDSAGCNNLPIIGTSTIQVDMNPPLTPTIAATTPTVCAGLNTTLSIQNQPTYTLSWFSSTSTNTISLDSMVVVNPSVATCYTVNAIDPLGCIGSGTICIGINPAPLLSLTMAVNPSTICPGQTATMAVAGGVTYTWSPVSVVSPVNGSVVVGSPSVTTVYSVTGNNGYGCIGTQTIEAFVGNYPNLSIVASAPAVCAGFQATLTAQGAITYTWTGTTLTSPIYQQSISVSPGTYTLLGSNGGSCNRDTTKVIVLAPSYPLNISQSSPTTCITDNYPIKYSKPVTLTASGGDGTYYWTACNSTYMTYCVGPITDVRPPATTCYTVTSVSAVCSHSAATCVTVIPQFTMNVTPPLPAICAGDCINLSVINISTLAVGAASTYTYIWKEPISIPPIPITIDNPMNPTVTACPEVTTIYTVEVRDVRSCVSVPRLVTVTVLPQPITSILIPTINTIPTNTVCYVGNLSGSPNNTIILTGVNQNSGLPNGVTNTYTWMSSYDAAHSPFITSIYNNAVTVKGPLRLPQIATFTLQSGYNGVPGCKRLDTVSVRVIDCRPVSDDNVRFTSDMREICTRQCVSFMNLVDTAAGTPQQYYWQFPGGAPATSTLANPTVCYNLPSLSGGYNVVLTVTNPYLGPSAGTETVSAGHTWQANYIKVVDIPNVTIVPPGEMRSDTVIRFGDSVKLKGSGATSFSWSPDYNISSLTGASVVVNPYQTTQYILRGYNNKNCFSSDTINVIVIEDCGEMFVPNAFSPNGDGHNDKLYVRGVCLKSMTFMIFDRWGEKVFETNTQSEGWDGKYKGEDMNSGVFVFRLEGKTYEGKAYSLKGNITLIR